MRCAVAMGSNLGDRTAALDAAVAAIGRLPRTRVLARSSTYETEAEGPPQGPYLNGVLLVATGLEPGPLLDELLRIESVLGRVRRARWEPRPIDLDLLYHGERVVSAPGLEIPHPRLAGRPFVLAPLAEVAPDWVHPATGQTVAAMIDDLAAQGGWRGILAVRP